MRVHPGAGHTENKTALTEFPQTRVPRHDITWTSKMAKIMDPILPILSVLRCWAIILGSFGGPGTKRRTLNAMRKFTEMPREQATPLEPVGSTLAHVYSQPEAML